MAQMQVVFEKQMIGSGLTVTKDDWFDLTGAMVSGRRIWLGFSTMISQDKSLTFELRSNLATKGTGNLTDTKLLAFTSVVSGESKDVDLFLQGMILTLSPDAPSTGVERLWLRVRSNTVNTAAFDYLIWYTEYN